MAYIDLTCKELEFKCNNNPLSSLSKKMDGNLNNSLSKEVCEMRKQLTNFMHEIQTIDTEIEKLQKKKRCIKKYHRDLTKTLETIEKSKKKKRKNISQIPK